MLVKLYLHDIQVYGVLDDNEILVYAGDHIEHVNPTTTQYEEVITDVNEGSYAERV